MATAAIFAGRYVARRLACLVCSVVARGTGLLQPVVREGGGEPAQSSMAYITVLRGLDMFGRLHLRNDPATTAVAASTCNRCPFEYAVDVTAFAGSITMHPR